MILAAGMGTRLMPLTSEKPKPLVPVGNRPVIDLLIQHLKEHRIDEIVVNAHHHHRQITRYLDKGRPFGIEIEVKVEEEILGTGGGIKNTQGFWGTDPFIVINGDILTDIDLTRAYAEHCRNGNMVTLVLHPYEAFNQIQIDDRANIKDIGIKSGPDRLAFTGIHIVQPELLDHIPHAGFSNIIDCYRNLIRSGYPVRAHLSHGHYWRDMGTLISYSLANKEALQGESLLLGSGCQIDDSASIKDWAVIGEDVRLEADVEIKRSVLWKGAVVRKGSRIVDCIVTPQKKVSYQGRISP